MTPTHRESSRSSPILLAVIGLALLPAAVAASPSQSQLCESAIMLASANFARCRLKAEATYAKTGDSERLNDALARCSSRLTSEFQRAEGRYGLNCIATQPVDAFDAYLTQCSNDTVVAAGGGVLPDCNADLDACDAELSAAQSGTALEGDVLAGKTFSSAVGLAATGAMPDNGAVSIVPGTSAQSIAAGYHNGLGSVAGDADLVAGNIASGVDIFGVAGTAMVGTISNQLLKTGQTTSYGTGTDGDLQLGGARNYIDNGDGTITDTKTGLVWEKKDDGGGVHDKDNMYTWSHFSNLADGTAFTSFLATLNSGSGFAGHTDWRLPNAFELSSIMDLERTNPATSLMFSTPCWTGCTVAMCSCIVSNALYLSSSTYLYSHDMAWTVNFLVGGMLPVQKRTATYYARAVRSGS